jgi:DNA topoisomerase-1
MTKDGLTDARASARAVGLRYVLDGATGLSRRRHGRGFTYTRADGSRVTDRATLDRIRSLVIPPAWTDVWIAPVANAHLQAVGRDARGRKQYRYHPLWRTVRDEIKYERMTSFATAIPALRRRVRADLRRLPLSRAHVLATVIRLLDLTLIRVGNDEYARANRSYGLTTLRNRHVAVRGSRVRFRFRAKSGVSQTIAVRDAALARVVRQCKMLPGSLLFQYVDAEGRPQAIDSADVNAYLRRATGLTCSAKDFRTWAGTVLAAVNLAAASQTGASIRSRKRAIVRAVDLVAERLGNTRAVCRSCYIHPGVLEAFLDGETIDPPPQVDQRREEALATSLPPQAEAAVLLLLRRRQPAAARAA